MTNITIIYVLLHEDSIDMFRPTEAIDLGSGLYKILPTPDYNPEFENWQFVPGTIVKCELRSFKGGENVLVAIQKVI